MQAVTSSSSHSTGVTTTLVPWTQDSLPSWYNPYKVYFTVMPDAHDPVKKTRGAAGYDLFPMKNYCLGMNKYSKVTTNRLIIDTGVKVSIPVGHYGRLATRSSTASKGVIVLGGVIDQDYRGTLKVILLNTNFHEEYLITPSIAIAQLIIEAIGPDLTYVSLADYDLLPTTQRAGQGFGSTDQHQIVNNPTNIMLHQAYYNEVHNRNNNNQEAAAEQRVEDIINQVTDGYCHIHGNYTYIGLNKYGCPAGSGLPHSKCTLSTWTAGDSYLRNNNMGCSS